jgi:hypothetical protein
VTTTPKRRRGDDDQRSAVGAVVAEELLDFVGEPLGIVVEIGVAGAVVLA